LTLDKYPYSPSHNRVTKVKATPFSSYCHPAYQTSNNNSSEAFAKKNKPRVKMNENVVKKKSQKAMKKSFEEHGPFERKMIQEKGRIKAKC
jgi:hypothetical protein